MDIPEVDVNEEDDVVVSRSARPEQSSTEPDYAIRLHGHDAAALAQDLLIQHQGSRLYPAAGTARLSDGTSVKVLELGSAWSWGQVLLTVTSPPTGSTLDPFNRVTVEEIDLEERWHLAARLASAAARVDY